MALPLSSYPRTGAGTLDRALVAPLLRGASREGPEGLLGGAPRHVDVLLLAPQVDAPEAAERADLEDVDLRRLLRLVRRDRGVARGGDLEDVERLAGDDQVPVPRPVDELGVVRRDVPDHLARRDLGLDAVLLLQPQRVQDRAPR